MKKLCIILLLTAFVLVGCQPAATPCSNQGWAQIADLLYEFDDQTNARDPKEDISILIEKLQTTRQSAQDLKVDSCTEHARGNILLGMDQRIEGLQLIASGDGDKVVTGRTRLREANWSIRRAAEELAEYGFRLAYPTR